MLALPMVQGISMIAVEINSGVVRLFEDTDSWLQNAVVASPSVRSNS
ncbi:hypothetical protein I6M36_14485 [Shewanella algae]|nr:hypothetical protein [Shewanella algae]MBO2548948.1 hypothetical protein [Shewanella algae]